MTAQLLALTKQITTLSKEDENSLWDFLNQRREDADILAEINRKLAESEKSAVLSDAEVKERLSRLGIEP